MDVDLTHVTVTRRTGKACAVGKGAFDFALTSKKLEHDEGAKKHELEKRFVKTGNKRDRIST